MSERTRPIRIEFCVTEQEKKLIQHKMAQRQVNTIEIQNNNNRSFALNHWLFHYLYGTVMVFTTQAEEVNE